MQVRVVIRDTRDEEQFELTGEMSARRLDRLKWLAEKVAQGTGWDVTIAAEKAA